MHRDVAPDNILMLYDRAGGNDLEQAPRPVLLDFGAPRRLVADATGRYSQSFLAAIDAGLAVRPEQRPQSMAAWWECFNRPEPPAPDRTVPVHAVTAPGGVVDLPLEPPAQPKPGTRWWYVAAVVAVGALALALFGRR